MYLNNLEKIKLDLNFDQYHYGPPEFEGFAILRHLQDYNSRVSHKILAFSYLITVK
jgi:hypothetical protein